MDKCLETGGPAPHTVQSPSRQQLCAPLIVSTQQLIRWDGGTAGGQVWDHTSNPQEQIVLDELLLATYQAPLSTVKLDLT